MPLSLVWRTQRWWQWRKKSLISYCLRFTWNCKQDIFQSNTDDLLTSPQKVYFVIWLSSKYITNTDYSWAKWGYDHVLKMGGNLFGGNVLGRIPWRYSNTKQNVLKTHLRCNIKPSFLDILNHLTFRSLVVLDRTHFSPWPDHFCPSINRLMTVTPTPLGPPLVGVNQKSSVVAN